MVAENFDPPQVWTMVLLTQKEVDDYNKLYRDVDFLLAEIGDTVRHTINSPRP